MRTFAKLISILSLATLTLLSACTDNSPEGHIQAAKKALQKADFKVAAIELKSALQSTPNNIEARLLLGQALQSQGQWADSEKELRKALELGASKEEILPWLVRTMIKLGKIQEALDMKVPSAGMGSQAIASLQAERANAFIFLNKPEVAAQTIRDGESALASSGTTGFSKDLQLAKARLAYKNNQPAQAMALLDEVLQRDPKFIEGMYTKAQLFVLDGKPAEAQKVYQQITAAKPGEALAYIAISEIHLHAKNAAAAEEALKAAEKVSPNMPQVKFTRAKLELSKGEYKKAIELVQQVLRTSPNHMPAILLQAAANYALGNYEQSLKAATRVLVAYPDDLFSAKLVASNQLRTSEIKAALDTLGHMLKSHPDDIQLLSMAAEAHMLTKQNNKAMEYLERAAALQPKNADIKQSMARGHLALGQSERALAELEQAANLSESTSTADINLILLHMARREYDRALLAIAKLEKKLPNSPVANNLRATVHLRKNDRVAARNAYEKALAIQPDFFAAAVGLAQLDLQDKKPESARKRFESILNKDGKNLEAMMAMAEIAAADKKESEYLKWLEQAAKANPQALEPRAALVNYHVAKKAPQKALSVAREAVTANPESPEALSMLGSAQMAAGDQASAVATYTTINEKTPNSAEAQYRLGVAQVAANHPREGRASMEKALAIKPSHVGALDGLLLLDMLGKKFDVAMQRAQAFQTKNPKSPVGFTREADILFTQKQYAPAAKIYEQALIRGAGLKEFAKMQASLTRSGNQKLADQKLVDQLKRQPDDIGLQNFAAEYYMTEGRDAEAIRLFEALRAKLPNNSTLLNNLAGLYQKRGDARALETAALAYKIDSANPAIADTYGWLLVEQGQVARGLELLRYAVDKAKTVSGVRYRYAAALAKSGQKAEARKQLEELFRAGQTFPESEAAKALLQKL